MVHLTALLHQQQDIRDGFARLSRAIGQLAFRIVLSEKPIDRCPRVAALPRSSSTASERAGASVMHERLEHYRSDGFVVTEPIFGPEEIGAAIQSVDEMCARSAYDSAMAESCVFERDQPKEKRGGIEVSHDETAVFIVGDVPRFCPGVLSMILKDELIDLVSDLLGTHDIVTHFANLTAKAAKIGSGINWHRDYPNKFMSPVSPDMVRTMICLDGMSVENGATAFLCGSHKAPEIPAASIRKGDKSIVTATCEPGGIVAIHPLVLHGGAPNFSSLPRRNIVVQWGRRDVPLATDVLESITGKTIQELQDWASSTIGAGPY